MTNGPVFPDHLPAGAVDLQRQAARDEQKQATLGQALNEAIQEPHTIHEHRISATGVVQLSEDQRALMIGLVTGEQHRVLLSEKVSLGLGKALSEPFQRTADFGAKPEPEEPGS